MRTALESSTSSHAVSFDSARFLAAQESTYVQALAEIRAGQKRTHWMWFIFPQLRGLGRSEMAERYALSGADAARQYLAHPVLGARLRECVEALTGQQGRTASQIFGFPDDLKLHSSLTLFAVADSSPGNPFERALEQYFAGRKDEATLTLLGKARAHAR